MRYYYCKRIQSKTSKREKRVGQSPEESRCPSLPWQWAVQPLWSVPREACWRLSVRVSIGGWVHRQAPSACHVPKSQTLPVEGGVQHKPHLPCKQVRHSEPSCQEMMETLPRSRFLEANQGAAWWAGLPGDSSLSLLCELCYTRTQNARRFWDRERAVRGLVVLLEMLLSAVLLPLCLWNAKCLFP